MDEIARWAAAPEGQFFERKSAFDRSGGRVRQRPAADLARDVAETLAAMANADGGELVVGMEDDGEPTGIPHAADRVALLERVPGDRNYLQPPLRAQVEEVRDRHGRLLLHFGVDWSPEVHRLADGRYVLRVNDANMPFPAEQIAALKSTKGQGLVERAYEAIRPFIRERQQLHDLLFTERLEYPTFVWQEAIVNAVAHRDYAIQGAPIEVWMFDDRIEVRSPGLPPHPVTVEALNRREHLHVSRNPLIVRVLAALGYMRELGEGIPRMFAEMEREG